MESFLAYQARRRTDNCPSGRDGALPSASLLAFSSQYDVYEQLLDNGESSAGFSLSLTLFLSRAHLDLSLSDSIFLALSLSVSLSHTLTL